MNYTPHSASRPLSPFCATVGFSDGITSANVVGYQQLSRPEGYQNFCGGSMFVNCAADNYTLADITISGPTTKGNARNNYLVKFASGSTIKVDKSCAYWWDPVANTWRIRSGTNFNNDPTLSDPTTVVINKGEGFMCNFGHSTTKITYAGQVIKGTDSKIAISRPDGYQNFVAVNPAGREISLSEISMSGPTTKGNAHNNYFVFMAAGSTIKVDKSRSYWWDPVASAWRIRSGTNFNNDPTVPDATAIKIPAGEGFMCNFGHATTVMTLPTAL